MCACSPGARDCETLQIVSSRREDAGRNRRHPDGIGAIKLEAAPRYHKNLRGPGSHKRLGIEADLSDQVLAGLVRHHRDLIADDLAQRSARLVHVATEFSFQVRDQSLVTSRSPALRSQICWRRRGAETRRDCLGGPISLLTGDYPKLLACETAPSDRQM